MAIKNEDDGNTSAPAGAARAAPNNPNNPKAPGSWSFHDNGLFQSPIPKGIGSEYYTKLKDRLTEIYKSAHRDVEIGIVELSRATDPALDFSCLLVVTRLHEAAGLGVAAHILLLAETGEDVPTYTEQIYERTITVHRVPSDAVNQILVDKAIKATKLAYPGANVTIVDSTVVPKNFDPDNKTQLQRLALNAAMAGVSELTSRRPEFEDLNLAKLNKTNQSAVEVTFHRQQLQDAAANVYRSDLLISFTDRKSNENQRDRQLNTGDRNARFSELSSFLDVLWLPHADNSGGFSNVFTPQHMAQTQKFVARQVITDITANYSQTPGAVLLALSTALSLRNPSVWIQSFRPLTINRKELDMTDIGALNIEGNIPVPQPNGILAPDPSGYGKPIDTKADDFKSEQLGLYIAALFHKDLVVAMDVPEAGPQTQYLSVFAAAAKGVQPAYDSIYNSANELTNGIFTQHFVKNQPIFATMSERIHAGTWVDINGQTRDLRDFDHIAVANLVGTRQPQMIRDWSDTFLRLEYPEIQRLEARRKMLIQLSNDTARFTGYYQRVTFSGKFLDALDLAILSHNLRVTIRTPMSGNDFYNQRGVASYANNALLGHGQSYMQQGGYGSTAGPTTQYYQYRW